MESGTTALLLPEAMQAAALGGAAEILVEERPGTLTPSRRFLHIFDDYERREKISSDAAAMSEAERTVHEQRLKDYRWACSTLWSHDQLQAFLASPEPALWPELDTLHRAVDLVCQLSLYTPNPSAADVRTREHLKRAVAIIEREMRYAGVHPLKEAPVAGQLVPYEVNQWLRSSGTVKMSVPDVLERRQTSGTGAVAGNSAWLVEVSTTVHMASEVLRLPVTARAAEKLVNLVLPPSSTSHTSATVSAPQDPRRTWQALVAAHTHALTAGTAALAGSVADAVVAFQTSEKTILTLAHHAAEERDARVRLRMGVFVTVIHRELLFLVSGRAPKAGLTSREKEKFQELTGLDFGALTAGGFVRLVEAPLMKANVDEVVRQVFLSPAWSCNGATPTDAYAVEAVGVLGGSDGGTDAPPPVMLYKVSAAHNPFLVIHGPRVMGGPTGADALSGLLKRRREAEADAELQQAVAFRAEGDVESAAGHGRGPTAGPSSVTSRLRGGELRAAVERVVVNVLAAESMSKAALSAHPALAEFARLKEFDAILKETLKTHTEYRNRKYILRQ